MRYYDKLIFELSHPGRTGYSLPSAQQYPVATIPANLLRESGLELPEVSEVDVVRHYTNLSQMNFGVDTGFYPLGSCTMKYNPKINEEIASHPGFSGLHPLQPNETVKGAFEVLVGMDKALAAITGMILFHGDVIQDQKFIEIHVHNDAAAIPGVIAPGDDTAAASGIDDRQIAVRGDHIAIKHSRGAR